MQKAILVSELLDTTGTEASNASGACSMHMLRKELHDKNERGGKSDAHVNYSNYTSHRALLTLYGIEFQAEY